MALLITFEGGEASGKSTQASLLKNRLKRLGHELTAVVEPGGTPLGQRLRYLLKYSSGAITPSAELFLFLASRAQLVQEVIAPALKRGNIVICDRFTDSTLAYQGYGRGLDLALIRHLNQIATGGLKPDLTVLPDMPVAAAQQRRRAHRRERFESEKGEFLQRVRKGYLALAREEPQRWLVVDGTLPRREVSRLIWERLAPLLRNEKRFVSHWDGLGSRLVP